MGVSARISSSTRRCAAWSGTRTSTATRARAGTVLVLVPAASMVGVTDVAPALDDDPTCSPIAATAST